MLREDIDANLFESKNYTKIGNNSKSQETSRKYKKPQIKKIVYNTDNTRIVMGCWTENNTINNGDGC